MRGFKRMRPQKKGGAPVSRGAVVVSCGAEILREEKEETD
jgi:hypothetical protein